MTVYTIGVYGFDATTFSRTLQKAGVTAIVDIRQRRGVRGALYSFANATALKRLVNEAGIGYIAERRLAPPSELRIAQRDIDEQQKVLKRDRAALSPEFIAAYKNVVLTKYLDSDLAALLARSGQQPCLFCVEGAPAACHRSIAAAWISERTQSPVINLLPDRAR